MIGFKALPNGPFAVRNRLLAVLFLDAALFDGLTNLGFLFNQVMFNKTPEQSVVNWAEYCFDSNLVNFVFRYGLSRERSQNFNWVSIVRET